MHPVKQSLLQFRQNILRTRVTRHISCNGISCDATTSISRLWLRWTSSDVTLHDGRTISISTTLRTGKLRTEGNECGEISLSWGMFLFSIGHMDFKYNNGRIVRFFLKNGRVFCHDENGADLTDLSNNNETLIATPASINFELLIASLAHYMSLVVCHTGRVIEDREFARTTDHSDE